MHKSSKDLDIQLKEGLLPEVYTEEHEKLLGDCQTPWTLCIDGYDEDGKCIYDPENGESCHQCRQKTLGLHTHCSLCNLVQGQFCGDCLYMRYGENVNEVNQNPNWVCPVCRGICNCSLCRREKGWAPTGCISNKVRRKGFKSVAHFLIQTRRRPRTTLSEEDSCSDSETRTKPSSAGKETMLFIQEDEPSSVDKHFPVSDAESEMEEEEGKPNGQLED